MNNITSKINNKIGVNLHKRKHHPIEIIKNKIYDYFGEGFNKFEDLDPVVKINENFDKLLIPKEHPSRSYSDTYYVDEENVLRTHTSAHQNELLIDGHKKFLVTGDVYRKDSIDKSHYPVFHQMEGVGIVEDGVDPREALENVLVGLVKHLFPNCEYKISDDYFPFTDKSIEIEIKFDGQWLEILGGGVIKKEILTNCGLESRTGWAFGLGLERLAMILFKIPDIRYFWTDDERFSSQFVNNDIIEFREYSKQPPCYKDVTFWLDDKFAENDFCEIVRERGDDLVENIKLIDDFKHPISGKTSHCYRVTYRSNDRSLRDEEVNTIQDNIRNDVETKMGLELR